MGKDLPPVANWLGDAKDRQGLDNMNLPRVTDGSLRPGDIIAWRNTDAGNESGHSTIYIGGGVVVYAASADTGGVPKAQTLSFVDGWARDGWAWTTYGANHEPYVVRRYNVKP
jgi:cell wall-associated NlpC family hydrolase